MYPKLILATVALGSPVLYVIYLHRQLSRKIRHSSRIGLPPSDDSATSTIDSIPAQLRANPTQYHTIHDISSRSIPTDRLPIYDDSAKLLTTYLKYNMSRFARLPQAYLLYLVVPRTPSTDASFDPSQIRTLGFAKGDLVCGVYRVEVRTPGKVEFAISPPKSSLEEEAPVNGRLVISIEARDGQSVFSSETVMWRKHEGKVLLPLERSVLRWMHELASWWLLESGTAWMVQLGRKVE